MTSNQYIRSLSMIFYALISGQVLLLLTCVFLISTGNFDAGISNLTNNFLIVGIILTIFGVWRSNYNFKRALVKIKKTNSITGKLKEYREALVKKYAFLEMPSFFCIIAFLLTGKYFFILFPVIIIILFLTDQPQKEKLISDLELNYEEQKFINNPDSIID